MVLRLGLMSLWLAGCGSGAGTPTAPGVAPVQRLTPTEYNQSLADLFGQATIDALVEATDVEFDGGVPVWPRSLPPDQPVHGFEGMVDGQVASPWLVEQYAVSAEAVAPLALQSPLFFPCSDVGSLDGADERACSWDGVLRFAQRAWRRPLRDAEVARLDELWQEALDVLTLEQAVVSLVEALLQSPPFLYRLADGVAVEGDGFVPLGGFELASRLSYLLWDSMPDAELFEAASAGELSSAEGVAGQARRMLRDPRARAAVVRFHTQWLGLDAIYGVNFDRAAYAELYAPGLAAFALQEEEQDVEEYWSTVVIGARAAMMMEAERFMGDVVFDRGGTLADLLTDHGGYVTQVVGDESPLFDTRELAGDANAVPRFLGAVEQVELSDDNLSFLLKIRKAGWPRDQRAGVLTLPAWLASSAHPVHPAPILRGVTLIERLACESMGQPPASAAGSTPPDVLAHDSTNRERLEAITSSPTCQACHERINPVGFAFENYDSFGGHRTRDGTRPVDASGSWTPGAGPTVVFDDAVELAHQLSTHPVIQDCYVRQWLRYAVGTDIPAGDERLAALQRTFRASSGDVTDLLVDLVSSPIFRHRALGGAE